MLNGIRNKSEISFIHIAKKKRLVYRIIIVYMYTDKTIRGRGEARDGVENGIHSESVQYGPR